MKLRITKFSSEGLGGNSAKFCTSENFPLYGIFCAFHYQLLDVFASEDDLASAAEEEREKREREAETAEARETVEQWSKAYTSHGVHKPHHYIGSISEIIKKLPEGLQISRVCQPYFLSNIWTVFMYCYHTKKYFTRPYCCANKSNSLLHPYLVR